MKGIKWPYDVKVGACADYLLGKSIADIAYKWGVSDTIVSRWIRNRGCFKLRRKRRDEVDYGDG